MFLVIPSKYLIARNHFGKYEKVHRNKFRININFFSYLTWKSTQYKHTHTHHRYDTLKRERNMNMTHIFEMKSHFLLLSYIFEKIERKCIWGWNFSWRLLHLVKMILSGLNATPYLWWKKVLKHYCIKEKNIIFVNTLKLSYFLL